MRPRNVLTQTNNMRKLMGLPLLNEDTGATVEDVKKKVLTEDRSFSLGFANNGGLTIAEDEVVAMISGEEVPVEEVTEQEEKFKFYDPSTEEHEYWDDLADTDEESAYYDWFEDNEDRLYSARNIDNAGGYVVTNGADWDYFKTEWYNSDNYEKYIKTIERRQEKDNKKQGRKDSRDLNKKVRQGYKEKRKKEREERRGREERRKGYEEGDAEVDYWGVEVDAGINEGGLGLNTDAQVFAEQGALDANKEYEVKDKSGEVVGTYKSNRKPFAFRANPGTPYKNGDKIPEGLSMDTGWENWDYEKHKFKDKEDPIEPGPLRIKETTGGSFAKYNITLQDKMDVLGEQRKDKKRYNFDTIEIEDEDKKDEKIFKKFDNILKRQGFDFTHTVSGADDDSYNHHHFYEWKDDVKDTIEVTLTQVDDGIMTGEWGYGDYYNITYSPGDNVWEEYVTIDGAMNKDTIQNFKRDIKTVLKDNMDKDEGIWY